MNEYIIIFTYQKLALILHFSLKKWCLYYSVHVMSVNEIN